VRTDDEALDWGDGADDPTYVDGARRPDAPVPAEGPTPAPAADDDAVTPGPGILASVLVVAYGILAGVYALSVIGWISSLAADTYSSSVLAFEILYQFGQFLAIVSPVLWFAAVFVATRTRPVARVVALAIGVLVIAPWPLIVASLA
jgi:hypothetical protein